MVFYVIELTNYYETGQAGDVTTRIASGEKKSVGSTVL